MSKFERLLLPGSTERPDCRCGRQMTLFKSWYDTGQPKLERRVYQCGSCNHELKLNVWLQD